MPDPARQGEVVLETEALSRNFGGLAAVRDVGLTLRKGELHAVIGPNGAGKSTLANLISGEIAPSSGSIRLCGADITRLPMWRRTRAGIGRSFQRVDVLAPLTVLENVRLAVQALDRAGHALRGARRRARLEASARETLARVGLADEASRLAGALSHGAQRQLEIAMALAGDPALLLLDEPLAGMGQEELAGLTDLLRTLSRDRAVLLIEHDMDFVFAVADWMTVMVEGAVLAQGRPAEIRANRAVQEAYLGVPA